MLCYEDTEPIYDVDVHEKLTQNSQICLYRVIDIFSLSFIHLTRTAN